MHSTNIFWVNFKEYQEVCIFMLINWFKSHKIQSTGSQEGQTLLRICPDIAIVVIYLVCSA